MRKTAFRILFSVALVVSARAQDTAGQIEPGAGSWKTWVISSGKDFRVPPPPDAGSTKAELEWLRVAIAEKDSRIAAQVKFWDRVRLDTGGLNYSITVCWRVPTFRPIRNACTLMS